MSMENVPLLEVQNMGIVADRRAAGKALRKKVARSSHAEWSPAADRPDPVSLAQEQNRTRFAHLVPIPYVRLTTSPFGFLRGSSLVMAQDLSPTPVSCILEHLWRATPLIHFGIYLTPDPNHVF